MNSIFDAEVIDSLIEFNWLPSDDAVRILDLPRHFENTGALAINMDSQGDVWMIIPESNDDRVKLLVWTQSGVTLAETNFRDNHLGLLMLLQCAKAVDLV